MELIPIIYYIGAYNKKFNSNFIVLKREAFASYELKMISNKCSPRQRLQMSILVSNNFFLNGRSIKYYITMKQNITVFRIPRYFFDDYIFRRIMYKNETFVLTIFTTL